MRARVTEYTGQVERRLSGDLTEDQFKPLRLMNGVYLQLHAYMLRVASPYGTLSSRQMRRLAHIARTYDKGYGHFTTRQNIQFNWPTLIDTPKILEELAEVEMHAIQTSGNCIRNVTADHFSGAAVDEVADPRPYAEILRQWSSIHPEFSYLPRKFKIAVSASATDRAAIGVHDIGLRLKRNDAGAFGFEVHVGGGQGRTPIIAQKVADFVLEADLLSYVTAIMRVYNLHGRRDNKYKARIKILVHELGLEAFREEVEREFAALDRTGLTLPADDIAAIGAYFKAPDLPERIEGTVVLAAEFGRNPAFKRWVAQNVSEHRHPDYGIVTISLKAIGAIPGDASADQMDVVADLAERFAHDEIRVSHEQNLVLPHVARADLPKVFAVLDAHGLGEANAGLVTDIIACPGLDYCALANARSIPVAQAISRHFGDYERQADIGELKIKISGCINACGHHHVGHIGILGVEKKGTELYQITLGGDAGYDTAIGKILGPGFVAEELPEQIEKLIETYRALRKSPEERFIDAVKRVGHEPFRQALYGAGEMAA